jgi:hypothetical protein
MERRTFLGVMAGGLLAAPLAAEGQRAPGKPSPRRVRLRQGPPPTWRGYMETILVVDDESEVRELARDVLVAGGYEVLEAGDGEEALRVSGAHTACRPAPADGETTPTVRGRPPGAPRGSAR